MKLTRLWPIALVVGCVAVLQLYDWLLAQDLTQLDTACITANTPNPTDQAAIIREAFGPGEIAERAVVETRAKAVAADQHFARLTHLTQIWPELAARLRARIKPHRTDLGPHKMQPDGEARADRDAQEHREGDHVARSKRGRSRPSTFHREHSRTHAGGF